MNPQKLAIKYRAEIKARMPDIRTAHDEKTHGYISPVTLKRYKSTTFYTGMLKDPSLAEFKMNRALAHIESVLLRNPKFEWTPAAIKDLLATAKLAPQDIFETAGDWGSAAHTWREHWFKEWIASGRTSLTVEEINARPLPVNVDGEVTSACRAVKKFLVDTGYIPVFCELPLVNDVLEVGGSADDGGIFPNPKKTMLDMKGDMWRYGAYKIHYKPYFAFVDLKTSNQGKKPAYAYQVRGFYQPMFTKIYKIRPQKTYILHTSKENGTYKLIDLTGAKFLVKESKYLVKLSRSYDRVKEYFEPKPMTI